MKKFLRQILLVILLITSSTRVFAEDRRDGNWWMGIQQIGKVHYMIGLFDGSVLGGQFAYWDYAGAKDPASQAATQKALSSFQKYSEKYMVNVTSGQLVDGVDAFYSDYKNRSIRIQDAAWIILKGIAGEPPTEAELNVWRQNAK